jgi:hypothetical protein
MNRFPVITAALAGSLLAFAAQAQVGVVHQGFVDPTSLRAGFCDKVQVVGELTLFAVPAGRADMMDIIRSHLATPLQAATKLSYQLGGTASCNIGDQDIPLIVWVQ